MKDLNKAAVLLGQKGGAAGTGKSKGSHIRAKRAAYTRWSKDWKSPNEWFEQRLNKQTETPLGCWEWTGSVTNCGYGHVEFGGQQGSAHRLAWIIFRGPIPDGTFVLHRCNNKKCCNPCHLYLGDTTINMRQASADGLLAIGERNGNAKLTAEQVKQVRILYNNGLIQTQLANLFGVVQGTISTIVRNKTWKHIKRDHTKG